MPRKKKVTAVVNTPQPEVVAAEIPSSETLRREAAEKYADKPIKTMVLPERSTVTIYRSKVVVIEGGRNEYTVEID